MLLMLATCSGAKAGASSMTTRPEGRSTYRVLFGSSGRQSEGLEEASTSAAVGGLPAAADSAKKMSAKAGKTLKLCRMKQVLHGFGCAVAALCLGLGSAPALAQMGGQMPGGAGQRPGSGQMSQPEADVITTATEKPGIAAKKASH